MKQNVITLFSATTLTGTTAVKSAAVPLDQAWAYCLQAQTSTGTPAGAYQMQGSCVAKDTPPTLDAQWFNVGSAITIAAAGSVGTNIPDVGYQWARVVFTPASGVGTVTFIISIKGA